MSLKLLVLGGNGFVGSHVCREALNHGLSVASLSRYAVFFFFFFLSLALETIRKELEIIELDRNKVYDRTLHTM